MPVDNVDFPVLGVVVYGGNVLLPVAGAADVVTRGRSVTTFSTTVAAAVEGTFAVVVTLADADALESVAAGVTVPLVTGLLNTVTSVVVGNIAVDCVVRAVA